MALPFEQQERESDKAFAAFSLYLNLGPQRSMAAVSKKLAKSEQLIKRWSSKYDWPARVQAHGAYLAVVEREAVEVVVRGKAVEWGKRQTELRQEEWDLHRECIQAAREALKRFYERGKGATLGDIARLLDLASKLGRLASGLATDRTEVTGDRGGPVRVEFELALKKIYGQVEPAPGVVDVEAVPALAPKAEVGHES
jgi:hypothetical protein